MKITCNLIKDLAELYVGGVLSEDSKLIVEDHIKCCHECREYINKSNEAFEATKIVDCNKLSAEKANFKSIKDRIVEKVVTVVIVTMFVVCTSLAIIDYTLFEHEIVIPYDPQTIYVTEDGYLHFPDGYDVSFTIVSSGNIRVQLYTNYISKLRGIESEGEEIVDLKEVAGTSACKMYYKDGLNEVLIWQ